MSSDIRSFFKPASGGRAVSPAKPKKRRAVISSDEEEDVKPRPQSSKVNSPKPNLKKLKSSDDAPAQKRKPVDPHAAFGDERIVRVERPKAHKTKVAITDELDSHFDEAFDDSLAEIDTSLLEEPATVPKSAPAKKHANGDAKKRTKAESTNGAANGNGHSASEASVAVAVKAEIKDEPTSPVKKAPASEKKKTPASRKRTADTSANLNDSVQTDEDRFEKKRMAAAMYQQFKNRGGPANPGSKELPQGKPTCLANLTFIITGVLESMERDEAADLIRAHGGKVTSSLSKKTTYMVQGEDAGLAKIAKAEEFKTTILTEDDLLNLIRKKSGLPTVEANSQPDTPAFAPPAVKKEVQQLTETVVKMEIESERVPTPTATGSNVVPKNDTVKIKTEPDVATSVARQSYRVETEHERNIASVENQAWVDKYKPTDVKLIIGQAGANSNVAKLTNWLSKWYVNQTGPKKAARPNPWAKNDDGAFFKAALLSGPPGVGKTTTATLVSRELGFDVVEFNASDTRSKRLLKEEVSELLSNKSLYGYFSGTKDAVTVKHVLLMDEVDGMAGNEDRGGMQELIALIRDSSVPVICMCNDRNHQKMRSLVNHCYDLRFARPQLNQIKGAMMSVCYKEGLKLAPSVIEEIITASNNDIRQTLNYLTLMSASGAIKAPSGDAIAAKEPAQQQRTAKKDMKLGPWEVVRKVFSAEEHKTMSLADKADLFFHDYSLGPLFVQQNYLQVTPRVAKSEIPQRVALAADSLSRGDLVESRIRSKMAWSMLPVQAMYSSVLPGEYMSGTFSGQINFPGWLGKHSKSSKRSRMAQEIHDHTRIRTSGSRLSIRLDYASFLIDAVARPMREHGLEGVDASLAVLKEYQLLREDIDSLLELSTWPGKKNAFDGIDGRVKAALTRAYNKDVGPYSFSAAAAVKKRKADSAAEADEAALAGGEEDGDEGAVVSDEEEDDGNLENDVLIKAKKKSATTSTAKSKPKSSASSSKAGGSGRAKSAKAK